MLHRLHIRRKIGPPRRHGRLSDPEEPGEEPGFAVIALALLEGEGRQHEVVGGERRIRQGRVHPQQSGEIVRSIGSPLDAGVQPMQPPGRADRVVEPAENQREHGAEGTVKAPNRVVKDRRMLGDRGGDEGVRELHQ